MTPPNERIAAIRAKLARGEDLDPGEQLDWLDAQEPSHEERSQPRETPELPTMDDDEEDVEHHDVGLRRNALNILYLHRGEMFGTAVPLGKDMNETLLQIQRMVAEIYAARREQQ